eukprot:10713681-Prorocentrum_lima.AAC.1
MEVAFPGVAAWVMPTVASFLSRRLCEGRVSWSVAVQWFGAIWQGSGCRVVPQTSDSSDRSPPPPTSPWRGGLWIPSP